MKENKEKKKFRLFDTQRVGKGISKTEDLSKDTGLRRFFFTLGNNFGKLVSVNIFMVLGNFPMLFLIAALTAFFKTETTLPLYDAYQNILGLLTIEGVNDPAGMLLYSLQGMQNVVYMPTVITYIFYGIGALTLFTFGPVNVGTAYILRNIAKGEPVFVWSDFWYAVKRNIKQALPFGMIDAGICALLAFNLYSMITNTGTFLTSMLFWCTVVLSLLYFFMRYYMYVQMVTFNLSVFKMLKNSLIFALLGLKRNILAFLGIIIMLVFEIFFLFGAGGILIPFALAAPLAVLFSVAAYMKVYAAYFKIKETMIDPYYPDEQSGGGKNEDEPIMRDDVTEQRRLDEIKRKNGIQDN